MAKIAPSGSYASGIVDSGRALQIFKSFLADKNAPTLDVGCGNGAFLSALAHDGYKNIFGIEAINYPELKKFKVKFLDVCFEPLPYAANSMQAVTAWEVFEHIENSRQLAREIHRVLAPGGLLFISLPNVFHLMSRLMFLRQGNFPRWTEENDHYNIFTHHILKKTFLANFNIIGTAYHRPEIGKGFLHPLVSRLRFLNRFLPEDELFSHFVVYVLKKR